MQEQKEKGKSALDTAAGWGVVTVKVWASPEKAMK